jgi:hypothetical protein
MNIPAREIIYKKIIGKKGRHNLWGIGSAGGLHLVCEQTDDGLITLGAGSHRAVARFITKKNNRDVEYEMLEKCDEVKYEDFADLVPFYEEVTKRLQK